jgi:hypothetical protein
VLCNIFQLMLAKIFDRDAQFAPHLPVRIIRQENAASFSEALEPRGNIYSVAKDISAIRDDITNIDAYAELNPSVARYLDIAHGHAALDIDRTTHGVDGTAKLSQQPISRIFDNPPTVLADFRIDERTQVFSELDVSSLFVQARRRLYTATSAARIAISRRSNRSVAKAALLSTTQFTPLD